jgi:hypothetical protein
VSSPSEPSLDWYGSLPRACRSLISGVKVSSVAEDDVELTKDWLNCRLGAGGAKYPMPRDEPEGPLCAMLGYGN